MNHTVENRSRSLSDIASELNLELSDFIATRVSMFRREMEQRVKTVRRAAPLAALGLLLVATAYLMFTLAGVALLAVIFGDSPFRWFFALFSVCILWGLFGGVCLYFTKLRLSKTRFVPEKTIAVLKEDKTWLQREARELG